MLNSDELVAYLSDERRRQPLNWRGIESAYDLSKGRIKNVVLYKKGQFRENEILALNKMILDLTVM
jgi:hypothetical protein